MFANKYSVTIKRLQYLVRDNNSFFSYVWPMK